MTHVGHAENNRNEKTRRTQDSAGFEPRPSVCDYEQPLVEPQLGHLWHAPLRTISVPHSWHGGASVSCTHARSLTSTTEIAGSMPDFTSTETKSLDSSGTFGRSSCAARAAG